MTITSLQIRMTKAPSRDQYQRWHLIPHSGANVAGAGIIGLVRRAEELDVESLWVRDHLLWEPHGMEGTNTTSIDPYHYRLGTCPRP